MTLSPLRIEVPWWKLGAMTETPTRLQRLIGERLDEPLDDFVARRRADGKSWRAIAAEIEQRTAIEISHAGLRKWFAYVPDAERAA